MRPTTAHAHTLMKRPVPLSLAFAAATWLAGAALTWLAVEDRSQSIRSEAHQRFGREVDRIAANLQQRFDRPLVALRSARGLFSASEAVSHEEYARFFESSGLGGQFAGVSGFGYAARVPARQVDVYVHAQRRAGGAAFRLRRVGDLRSTEAYPVQYMHPLGPNIDLLGQDLASENTRREAALAAAASGEARLSGSFNRTPGEPGPVDMLYILPIYRDLATQATEAQRMAALTGWLFFPIDVHRMLARLGDDSSGLVDFRLAEQWPVAGAPRWLFGREPETSGARAAWQARRSVEIGGRMLWLEAAATPAFDATVDTQSPRLIGWIGGLLSLALAALVWLWLQSRSRALAQAARMNDDLARLAEVVKRSTNAVSITDLSHRILWINEGFTRLYGHTPEQAQGKTPRTLLGTPYTEPSAQASVDEAVRTHSHCSVELRNRTRDGRLLWVDLELQPSFDPQGQPTGFIEIALDVTAERQTALQLEAAMRENEGLLSTIRQHAAVSVADPQGHIIDVNDAFCERSGYRRDELLGRRHSLLKSGVHSAEQWGDLWRTITQGRAWRGQVCNRAKDGSLYWEDSIVAPFRGIDGRIERFISIRTDITASKKTEQTLLANERFLDRVGRMAGVGGWTFDLTLRRLTLSGEVYRQLGLAPDVPVTPRALLRRFPAGARPDLMRAVRSALRTGEAWDIEIPMLTPDAHTLWMRVVGEADTDTQGRLRRLYGAAQDVTRRRELELGLRDSNAMLSGVVANLPFGLALFDPARRLVLHNDSFAQMIDAPAGFLDTAGLRLDDIVELGARRMGLAGPALARFLEAATVHVERPLRAEMPMARGRMAEVAGAPMPDGGFVRTYVDISDRKAREAEVRRADALLRGAIDTLNEAFVLYDPDDRLVLCNDKYREIFATSADLIQPGATFESILRGGLARGQYPQAQGREEEWLRERLALHNANAGHVVMKLDNGRWLRVIERRMPDGHNVGFRLDITDLMVATEAARSASRAKGQFLANMSHEIRTPLNAILGMLRLLQRTPLTPRQGDYAGKTESAARALLALVNDILDFSKIEAGKMELDPQPFRLDRMLGDLQMLLSAQLGDSHQVRLRLDLAPHLPVHVRGDALRLLQVLINLGGNAIKFTPRGEVTIRASALRLDEREAELAFEVVDTGVGIAPEHVQHIFSGFSQAEASITRRFGGTGLGLAISSRFVEMMGGTLAVDSQLGHGSRFHFRLTLPREADPPNTRWSLSALDTAAPALPRVADQPVVRAAPLRRLQGMRVLLVEDNANNRQVATELLEDEGVIIVAACDGQEGLDTLMGDRAAFDAVLMDIQMPVLDGLSATRRIRQDHRFDTLPIIAMSANVSTGDHDASIAAGLNDHIGKPFDLDHLVRTLQRWTGWEEPDDDSAPLPTLTLSPALAEDARACRGRPAGRDGQGAGTHLGLSPHAAALCRRRRTAAAAAG